MYPGRALRLARRRRGLTQRQLAELSGVPQSAIARIESGRVTPRVDSLDKLLRVCGETLETRPQRGIGVDRSLIREMLRLSPAQRLEIASVEANNLERLLSSAT
jgi:transcriptional regulator with XRE-family HTH domain